MQGSAVIIVIVIVVILFVLVRAALDSQKRTYVAPIVEPESQSQVESFYMEDSYAYNTVDLRARQNLVVIHVEDSQLKQLLLPTSTIQPAHLYLEDVDLGTQLTSVPSNLGSVEIHGTNNVAWASVYPQITSSKYLRRLEIGDIYGPPEYPVLSLGNITLAGYDEEVCGGGIDIYGVHNLSSIGNITLPSNFTSTDCNIEITIDYCNEMLTIGNIDANVTEGSVSLYVYGHQSLQSMGDIEISEISYLFIAECPVLETIGHIITSRMNGASSYYLYNNAFDSDMISQIFEEFDATGFIDRYIDLSGNPGSSYASLTPSGQIAHDNLQGKGWGINL